VGERFPDTEEAVGSIPSAPTTSIKRSEFNEPPERPDLNLPPLWDCTRE
jgi:hypothetical protein